MNISNLKLAIGIPCSFPFVPISFVYSILEMDRPDYVLIHADNGPIDTLRNDIVEKALQVDATHLIMLDTDMVYHPKTITSLLSRKLPVVGALCFRRYPPFDSIMLRLAEKEDGQYEYTSIGEWEDGDLIEVDATGAGCIMYNMTIFKDMPGPPWFKFRKNPNNGLTIGEDIGFCQDLKEKGYKIFVDTAVPCGHLTTMMVNRATHKLYMAMKTQKQKDAVKTALKVKLKE